MDTLARLCCWTSPDRLAEFEAAYEYRIAPVLKSHDLEEAAEPGRATVAGVFSRLFEVEQPNAVEVKARALHRDLAWQAMRQELGRVFGNAAPDGRLRCSFDLYRAPAGPGRTVEVGPGYRQGLWQRFEFQDHLPVSALFHLRQDRQGDLWLASMEGIWRYDGVQATALTTADGLVDDGVMCQLDDSQGRLWVGTFGGLSCLDGPQWTSYTTADGLGDNQVEALLEDQQGRLWIGTKGGLSCLDGPRLVNRTIADGLIDNRVEVLLEDRQGRLWVGTEGGLSCSEGVDFVPCADADGPMAKGVYSLLEDRQGRLWVGTSQGVSWCEGLEFTALTAEDGLARGPVLSMLEDREGHLWFATRGGGVSRYDGTRFVTFTVDDGLVNNQVAALCEDQLGDLWVGTWHGLNRYCKAQFTQFTTREGLRNHTVVSLAEDRRGHLWFGTLDLGVERYDGREFTHHSLPLPAVPDAVAKGVYAIQEDQQGQLWFATDQALFRYDGAEMRRCTGKDSPPAGCWRMLLDRQGRLWTGVRMVPGESESGLHRFDGQEWTAFTSADGLAKGPVWALAEDRHGRLWVGGHDGRLSVYDGKYFTILEGLPPNLVTSLAEDREGRLWVTLVWHSRHGGGVWRWDGQTFSPLSAPERATSKMISAALADRDGRLWFGSYGDGVYLYDGLVLQSLSRKDGLVHDAVQGFLQDRCGDIWIATDGGLTRYRPSLIPPALRLTEVIGDRRYGSIQELELPVSQKLVAFEFQGRSWTTSPAGMAYVYRLEGYQEQWQTTYQRRVEYQDLPLGNYTFQVRAVDRDLNYSAPVQVQLRVVPDPLLSGLSEALSSGADPFVGHSPALRQVQASLQQVAPTELTVLILGETGTGKGLAARLVHRLSPRQAGPFLQVNCGAIPQGLVESELFGHEKGAFTGAVARKLGKVELAEGGTLFLDEIGDLSLEAQAKLLLLLEEKTFTRVGGTQTLSVDARVIAATNRDLWGMVPAGTFRPDLYFRLHEFQVELPPLRERREDIAELAGFFAARMAAHLHKKISHIEKEALTVLQQAEWPGNVRELEHLIKRAVVVCPGEVIRAEDLGLEIKPTPASSPLGPTPEEYERQYLEAVLVACGWQIKGPQGAAARLGLSPTTLRSRLAKLGLHRPDSTS